MISQGLTTVIHVYPAATRSAVVPLGYREREKKNQGCLFTQSCSGIGPCSFLKTCLVLWYGGNSSHFVILKLLVTLFCAGHCGNSFHIGSDIIIRLICCTTGQLGKSLIIQEALEENEYLNEIQDGGRDVA